MSATAGDVAGMDRFYIEMSPLPANAQRPHVHRFTFLGSSREPPLRDPRLRAAGQGWAANVLAALAPGAEALNHAVFDTYRNLRNDSGAYRQAREAIAPWSRFKEKEREYDL
jgi:hypothetical protein